MPHQNIRLFQESITRELNVTQDRVRHLIGDANWAAEGGYKEAILRKIIEQFLPANLKIGTGFILGNSDHLNGTESRISTQLDIIIYEDKTPVIFREGDFVILTESAVRAVIEVKARVTNYAADNANALNNIIAKLNRLRDFHGFRQLPGQRKKFVGVFVYNYDDTFTAPRIDEALTSSNGLVNHISLGPDLFIRYWETTEGLRPAVNNGNRRCYLRYELRNLSFSYFISNLLHIVSDNDPDDRYWFSFPIAGTKEIHRLENIVNLPAL